MTRYLVVGAGVAGSAAARALLRRGAVVTVTDRSASTSTEALASQGARIVVAAPPPLSLLDDADEVVVSPGVPPHDPLVAAAVARGLEVYSEPELAWRLATRQATSGVASQGGTASEAVPPWLAVTGTNGKTTTTTMLAAILAAAGHATAALGNVGEPLVDATGYDVLAVELSSFQLHWSRELAPPLAALLNLAEDHLEWHGRFDAYAAAKELVWRGARIAIGNLDDPLVVAALDRSPAPRRVGFTLRAPREGELGVEGGLLVDRAFGAAELIEAKAVRPAGPHNIANALAAAGLALGYGVPPGSVRAGLERYQPQPHRNEHVATIAGIEYVNDSKATNPHAALGSVTAYPRVIWLAGGQLKGVNVDALVREVSDRLAGVVLLGVDRELIAAALRRHAPQVPVVDIASTDDGAMGEVVRAAAALARPGDTVLLAPAAASKDMFVSYGHRGRAFAEAVRALLPPEGTT